MVEHATFTRRAPWFKFYPGDWRADPALRMCSHAARGLWMDMLSIMHEADPYGHLLIKGIVPDAADLAGLLGGSEREVKALLTMLEAKGVFSRKDNGVIYSRRMERDAIKAEVDKAYGKRGGNPKLKGSHPPPDNPNGNRGVNGEDKAQSQYQRLDSTSTSSESSNAAREVSDMPRLSAWPCDWLRFAESVTIHPDDKLVLVKQAAISGEIFQLVCREVCKAMGITNQDHVDDWPIIAGWLRLRGPNVDVERDILQPIRAAMLRPKPPRVWTLAYFTPILREHWEKAA